jgi:hypothetical protein
LDTRLASEPKGSFRKVAFMNSEASTLNWQRAYPQLDALEEVHVHSLVKYAYLILGARELIAFHSGAVALASALKVNNTRLKITCLISDRLAKSDRQRKDLIHNYEGVDYVVP